MHVVAPYGIRSSQIEHPIHIVIPKVVVGVTGRRRGRRSSKDVGCSSAIVDMLIVVFVVQSGFLQMMERPCPCSDSLHLVILFLFLFLSFLINVNPAGGGRSCDGGEIAVVGAALQLAVLL